MRYSIFLLGLLFLSVMTLSHFACGPSPTSPGPTPTPVATPSSTSTPCVNSSQTPCTSTPTFTATDTGTDTATPTVTFTPTATGTPTNTPNTTGPIIVAIYSLVGPYEALFVSDATGTTGVANTSVTLISGGVTTPMSYYGLTTPDQHLYGKHLNFGFPNVTGNEYGLNNYYSAGTVMRFDVAVNGTLYSDSVTVIDGSPTLTVLPGPNLQCSWTNGVGNHNFLSIFTSTSPSASVVGQIGPPVPSNPYTIPNSAFTNEVSPGSGTDEVVFFLSQLQTPAFPGSNSQSTTDAISYTLITAY